MYKAAVVFLMLCSWLTLTAGPQAQQKSATRDCLPNAHTQAEMDKGYSADVNAAENELNRTYQTLLKQYADQPVFIRRLREAQRAWLRFRDAQIAMRFPIASQENPRYQWGSVYPMCYAVYKAELTRRRTQELEEWQAGIPESDVCHGSLRYSNGPK